MLSLWFANPIYFVFGAVMIAVGVRKRWLNADEWLLAALLLLIPYLTQSYKGYMASMGRFTAAAFPIYIVMARIALALPPGVVVALFALCGFLLGAYAALFATWRQVF